MKSGAAVLSAGETVPDEERLNLNFLGLRSLDDYLPVTGLHVLDGQLPSPVSTASHSRSLGTSVENFWLKIIFVFKENLKIALSFPM